MTHSDSPRSAAQDLEPINEAPSTPNRKRLNEILTKEGLECEEVDSELKVAEAALKKAKGSVATGWRSRRDALAEAALLLINGKTSKNNVRSCMSCAVH